MLVFFYIVFALLITGATVYGLHRYQTMEVEYNVDRTMPLPPLSKGFQAEPPALPSNEEATRTSKKSDDVRDVSEEASLHSAVTANEIRNGNLPAPATTSESWQARVNSAKKAGNFDLAYQICRENYPLWGAYNQSCIILRSRMKSLHLSRAESEKLLNELYRTAVIAELLHDKSTNAEHFTLNQLRKLPVDQLASEEFSYARIGYAELRLIRKSDVKSLVAHWGRPSAHALPRTAQPQTWDRLKTGLSA